MKNIAWNLIAFNLDHLLRGILGNMDATQKNVLLQKLQAARKQIDTAIEFLEKH